VTFFSGAGRVVASGVSTREPVAAVAQQPGTEPARSATSGRATASSAEDDGARGADVEGVLFDTITGTPPAGVVPLEVADPGPGDPATEAGLAAIAALPLELRKQVTRVTAARDGGAVGLVLADGTDVLWGDGSESERKAGVLVALLQQIEGGEVEPAGTLDISAPGAVVLR